MRPLKKLRDWVRGPKPYHFKHFERQEHYADDYKIVGEALLDSLDFDSVIDLGCAEGLLLRIFHAAGKDVRGMELSPEVVSFIPDQLKDRIRIGDFASMDGEADLVCCVEVAEHIRPRRSEELVDKLISVSRRWIYFTAAPPGQSGHGHINCRPMSDWIAWFEARGWALDKKKTTTLEARIKRLEKATWLCGNSVILRKA